MILFLKLFWTFFQIGLFGFGGGYAMISLIQAKVVTEYHWMDMGQFADIVAVSQMTPGPIGINSATYVGYTSVVNAGGNAFLGILGSATATFAVVLPSFILMLLLTKFLLKFKNSSSLEDAFGGIRPAVIGLLIAAALCLMTKENFGSYQECPWQFFISILIFLFAFFSQKTYKLNPIVIICLSAVMGILLL